MIWLVLVGCGEPSLYLGVKVDVNKVTQRCLVGSKDKGHCLSLWMKIYGINMLFYAALNTSSSMRLGCKTGPWVFVLTFLSYLIKFCLFFVALYQF